MKENSYNVNYFKAINQPSSFSEFDLEDILIKIKDCEELSSKISQLRAADVDNYKKFKISLPAFSVSTTFNKTRNAEDVKKYNGIIHLDYDHIDNPEVVKEKLKQLPFIYSCFVSPSGKGLKVFVKTNASIKTHLTYFKAISEECDAFIGLKSDPSVKDISRLCFVSSDPDLFLNKASEVYVLENIVLPEIYSGADLNRVFDYTSNQQQFYKGNRNNFTHLFACNANKLGISENEAVKFMSNYTEPDFTLNEVIKTISGVYQRNISEHGIELKANDSLDFSISTLDKTMSYRALRNLIGKNFVVAPESQVFFYKKDDGSIDFSRSINYTDLRLDLHDAGVKFGIENFKDFINTRSIEKINSLELFASHIKNLVWDKEDHISKLVKAAKLAGDFEENLYFIKKWICTAYAFGMRGLDEKLPKKNFSRVVFVLYSQERGRGKTEFFRKLGLSGAMEELMNIEGFEVYSELSANNNDDKRGYKIMLTNSLLLNIDDIDEIVIKTGGEIRSDISKDVISIRPLYKDIVKNILRRAAVCGSTNHDEILRNDDENRYLIFTITDIMDFEAINEIDMFQLWAQAREAYLLDQKNSLFKSADLDRIIEMSKKYIYYSQEEQAIADCFRYDPNPEVEMNFNDIIEVLNRNGHYSLNRNKLSSALKKLAPGGKIQKKNNGKRFFLVKTNEIVKWVPNSHF
jgi:hypothetical protein